MAKEPSAAQRKLFAKMGYAMPNGSFYIRPLPDGKSDLENAIRAVGRGEQGGASGASIRKHIMMRAAAIKLSSEIPDTWTADGTLKETSAEQSAMLLTDFFEHHGVKGMRWGEHKPSDAVAVAMVRKPGQKITIKRAAQTTARKTAKVAYNHPIATVVTARLAVVAYDHREEIKNTAYILGKVGSYAVKQATTKDSPLNETVAIGRQVVQGYVVHGITGVDTLFPAPNTSAASSHDRVISAAQDHESIAAAHMSAAAKCSQDLTDLQQNGLKSSVAKQAFGNDAASQSDWAFYGKNRQLKPKAVASLSNKLKQSHGNHVQLAVHHTKLAQKLKTKASAMSHGGLNFDPNFDIDVYLNHFGVKGMHWGQRKPRGPASEDHAQAVQIKGKVKDNGGIHALSNDELKTLNERLNLEANYSRLNPEEVSAGQKAVGHLFGVGGNVANQQANKYANKAASAAIDHLISEAGKKSASRKRNAPLRVASIK